MKDRKAAGVLNAIGYLLVGDFDRVLAAPAVLAAPFLHHDLKSGRIIDLQIPTDPIRSAFPIAGCVLVRFISKSLAVDGGIAGAGDKGVVFGLGDALRRTGF